MTAQLRNASGVDLSASDQQSRWEPNFAWGNAIAAYNMLPQGCGHWATSVVHENGDCHDNDGHGFVAAYNGNPTYNTTGLAPYIDLDGAGDYLSVADRGEIDITGTEAFVAAGIRGLAMACWVWVDTLGALAGIMSKWVAAGNQRAYRLIKTAGNALQFDISTDGIATTSVTGPVIVASTWYHVVCRYTPSTELMIQVNGSRTTNVAAIPATINGGSNAALEFGRTDGGNNLDGRMSMIKVSRSAWNSAICNETFWQTCALFGVRP